MGTWNNGTYTLSSGKVIGPGAKLKPGDLTPEEQAEYAGDIKGANKSFANEGGFTPSSQQTEDFGGDVERDVTGALGATGALPMQIDGDAPGTSLDTGYADMERERLTGLLASLQQQATTGGGAWEQTFRDATTKAASTAQALGQSQPGVDYQSQLRNIGNAQSGVAQRAVGEEETLRNQSKLDAQDRMAQLLGGMASQDIGQATEEGRITRGVRAANLELINKSSNARADMATGGTQALGASDGGVVPGEARVFGDDERNDTVHAKLSPDEIVIPRSITQGPDAPERAAEFVRAVQARHGGGGDGEHFADGGQTGIRQTSIEDAGGAGNVALSVFVPHIGNAATADALRKSTGTGVQGASVQNGGRLDLSNYDGVRAAGAGVSDLFGARAAGAGPSVAPQMMQRETDANIAAAMQAQQGGRTPAGDLVQAVGAAGSGSAGDAARQTAIEQSAGQRAATGWGTDQRARELQLASAEQEAAWQNTMMNAGMTLEQQAQLRAGIGAAGQGAAAIAGAGPGRGGDDDTAFDVDEPELNHDDDDFAHGGMVMDEEEKRRSADFLAALKRRAA